MVQTKVQPASPCGVRKGTGEEARPAASNLTYPSRAPSQEGDWWLLHPNISTERCSQVSCGRDLPFPRFGGRGHCIYRKRSAVTPAPLQGKVLDSLSFCAAPIFQAPTGTALLCGHWDTVTGMSPGYVGALSSPEQLTYILTEPARCSAAE